MSELGQGAGNVHAPTCQGRQAFGSPGGPSCRCSVQRRACRRSKGRECGLTLRCTRPATAGFARFRRRVNSNVRFHTNMRTLVAAFAAAAVVLQTASLASDVETVASTSVGGVRILMPSPSGFVETARNAPALHSMGLATTAPESRLLEFFRLSD